jgi:hypothetical protein
MIYAPNRYHNVDSAERESAGARKLGGYRHGGGASLSRPEVLRHIRGGRNMTTAILRHDLRVENSEANQFLSTDSIFDSRLLPNPSREVLLPEGVQLIIARVQLSPNQK